MSKAINEPTLEGFELGYRLSQFADAEEQKRGPLATGRDRCKTCAFRVGTYAGGSPITTMDALKCVVEAVPFLCHEDTKQLCSGYVLLRRSHPEKGETRWQFSDEMEPA